MCSFCCSGAVWSGHCSSGSFRNSGPFIHLPISCITCNPRDTWSATFSSPGMCFHWLGSELFWISPTLAETNGLKLREGLWNQARVILLSVKNLTSANWIVHSFSIVIARQKARKAAGVEFWVALGAGCHSRLSCNEVYFIGALFRFFGGCTRRRQMLLTGRLKRHTLPVILEFRVEPASLEANLFKLLHFCEEELDPPFLYIIIPVKTNLPQLFQTTATRSLMIRVLLFTERAFRSQKCTGRIVGVFLLSMGLRGILVRLLWFEQLDVFLEYANFDRELGWETKVWILYE